MSIQLISGDANGANHRIAIVVARFNQFIGNALVEGACQSLERNAVKPDHISIYQVPGAFEIPLVVKHLAESEGIDGIIALGAVIRGATPHFDYVAGECASGIQRIQLQTGKPIAFGVLTVDSIEQAIERAGTKAGNKGAEAAETVIEMINLLRKLNVQSS